MTKSEELTAAKLDLSEFKERNKDILGNLKARKDNISKLKGEVEAEKIAAKPDFPWPALEVGMLESIDSDLDKSGIITKELMEDNFGTREYDGLIGWQIDTDDSGWVQTNNDGDYYEISVTLTSPESHKYYSSFETCMAVGWNGNGEKFN